MPTPTDETELTVRHGATLRERYPLLMAQTSPTIPTMREQAEARGEPVPVGKTAAEVRAAGYVVAVDVPDDASLVESGDVPDERVCTATTGGAITGIVWTRGSRSVAEWLMAYEGVLVAMPPASLVGCHDDLTYALRVGVEKTRDLAAGTPIFETLAIVACAIGLLEAEAHRREKLLETAAKFSLAT
jgi:hypothetical protein